MGTPTPSAASHPIEEFLDYDNRGHSVILRRNVEHPGEPVAVPIQKKASTFSIPATTPVPTKGVSGGFGFFSDFQEVRNRLREKGLVSR